MGPRFPSGISPADGAARALSERAAHRADRDGRCADAARDRRAARARRSAGSSSRASTGRTSATASSRRTRRAASSRISSPRTPANPGIVYCLSRKKVEETAEWLAEQGIAALPYHAGMDACDAHGQPEALPARGRHRDGRDDRVRHGHRQAGRALRRASRSAEKHGRLLPGNRPRRSRRAAGGCVALLRARRCRHALADDRARRIERRAQARRARQARCAARLRRDDRVPAQAPARIFRRAARPGLRQLRQLPRSARDLGRERRRAEGAVVRLSHRPALRRRAPDRRAARRGRRSHPVACATMR